MRIKVARMRWWALRELLVDEERLLTREGADLIERELRLGRADDVNLLVEKAEEE